MYRQYSMNKKKYMNTLMLINNSVLTLGWKGIGHFAYPFSAFSSLNNNHFILSWATQVVLVVQNLPANAGDARDMGLIPGLGIFSGEGNGNTLQYSCLENPMDRGNLAGSSPWGHKESEMTERVHAHTHTHTHTHTHITQSGWVCYSHFRDERGKSLRE